MKIRMLIKTLSGIALLTLLWLLAPVYGFYAHQGHLPLSPFGWIELKQNEDVPVIQELHDPAFKQAGDVVLKIITEHRAKIHAPAISAAVAIDGKLVWAGAAGWADIAARTPATPATIFRIGSTSKALTATGLARLVDQGIVDLDTPISAYLDPLPNPDWADITPRQLASHMAGLPHYKENTDWRGLYQTVALQKYYADVRDAVDVFDGSTLLYQPGTGFYYSSLGTVLLGAVMSEAAGIPYRKVMQQEVFDPAGMTSTIVAPKYAGEESRLATFYFEKDGEFKEWRPVDLSHRLPAGGFAATSSDLARLGMKQLDDGFISPETRAAFWMPQHLSNGEVNEQAYAIGWRWREWEVEGIGIARNANHGGVSRGAQSWLLVFPDYNMAIAFNINRNTEEFGEFGHIYADLFREFALAINQRAAQ